MLSDLESPSFSTSSPSSHSSPVDYFSAVPSPSSHFSTETPSTTPHYLYCSELYADPTNPLLALRELPAHYRTSTCNMDASRLLQLQTAAAHSRPAAQPLQQTSSSSNSSDAGSSSGGTPPPMLCCVRCRRSSAGNSGMVQIGTNSYYCRHCASMVGFSAG